MIFSGEIHAEYIILWEVHMFGLSAFRNFFHLCQTLNNVTPAENRDVHACMWCGLVWWWYYCYNSQFVSNDVKNNMNQRNDRASALYRFLAR